MEVSRDDLRSLAEQPIGAPHLQAEADSHLLRQGMVKPSAELKATCKRVSKKWLPHGRKGVSREDARKADIEDAIEKSGGARGKGADA